MPYSRANLKKALSIADALDKLLEAKERMSRDVEVNVERASDYMQLALAEMEIESAVDAKERVEELQLRLPFSGLEQQSVDKQTGEVPSEER